jgi:hypothetical protein
MYSIITSIGNIIMAINLEDFLLSKRILHSNIINNYQDAINFYINNKHNTDIVTYTSIRHFVLFNISVLEKDEEDNYFYEFSIQRSGDRIDDIHFESDSNMNVQMSYYIGDIKYTPEEINEFIIIHSQYYNLQIRITFLEKPTMNDEFKIISRYYIINAQDRRILATSNIETKNMVYSNGICNRKNDV